LLETTQVPLHDALPVTVGGARKPDPVRDGSGCFTDMPIQGG